MLIEVRKSSLLSLITKKWGIEHSCAQKCSNVHKAFSRTGNKKINYCNLLQWVMLNFIKHIMTIISYKSLKFKGRYLKKLTWNSKIVYLQLINFLNIFYYYHIRMLNPSLLCMWCTFEQCSCLRDLLLNVSPEPRKYNTPHLNCTHIITICIICQYVEIINFEMFYNMWSTWVKINRCVMDIIQRFFALIALMMTFPREIG